MDLSDIRREIDQIDGQLLPLLCRRMDCSLKVAEYKAAHHLPVLNEERERQILDGVRRSGEEYYTGYGSAAALVFSSIMEASRSLQHCQLAAGDALRGQITGARRGLLPSAQARVVCQGVRGAYSDEAASRLFHDAHPMFVETFSDVFQAVADGSADYGVLPVENSFAGSVNEVYDLVMKHRFTIAAAVEIEVHHCLLARQEARREDLKTVYSIHQGLAQCADYIADRQYEIRQYSNTAAAAKMVAESDDLTLCAIASKKAAEIYNLKIIDENIQTVNNNCTRFIAISKQLVIPADANKISLIFALPHVTGSLYRTLSRFAMAGLNLTKLESRPTHSGEFEYLFYLDFEGSVTDAETMNLICSLSQEMPAFSFVGNYREGN